MSEESKSESAATAAPPEGDAATTQAEEAPTESPKAEDDSAPEEAKAEEPKAEEAKAEEPKAEEAKAEEPKAEEAKAEEPKAEEPKAEEAKAEEPKAEEPKAEEPKAEEAKKGGHKKGKKPPKAKPEPAPAPKKETPAEPKKGARIGEEEEKSAQDLLFDNLPLVIVVCVVFSLIPVMWTHYSETSMEDSQQAWTDYGDARKKTLAEAEYGRLVSEHADTTAAPYLKISWAAKLYETGEKAKVERARDLLKEVKRDYSHLDLVGELVEPQIKKIEAELASPRAHWAPATADTKAGGTSGGTAPTSSN